MAGNNEQIRNKNHGDLLISAGERRTEIRNMIDSVGVFKASFMDVFLEYAPNDAIPEENRPTFFRALFPNQENAKEKERALLAAIKMDFWVILPYLLGKRLSDTEQVQNNNNNFSLAAAYDFSKRSFLTIYHVVQLFTLLPLRLIDFGLSKAYVNLKEYGEKNNNSLLGNFASYVAAPIVWGAQKIAQAAFLPLRAFFDPIKSSQRASDRSTVLGYVSALTTIAMWGLLTTGAGLIATAVVAVSAAVLGGTPVVDKIARDGERKLLNNHPTPLSSDRESEESIPKSIDTKHNVPSNGNNVRRQQQTRHVLDFNASSKQSQRLRASSYPGSICNQLDRDNSKLVNLATKDDLVLHNSEDSEASNTMKRSQSCSKF